MLSLLIRADSSAASLRPTPLGSHRNKCASLAPSSLAFSSFVRLEGM